MSCLALTALCITLCLFPLMPNAVVTDTDAIWKWGVIASAHSGLCTAQVSCRFLVVTPLLSAVMCCLMIEIQSEQCVIR